MKALYYPDSMAYLPHVVKEVWFDAPLPDNLKGDVAVDLGASIGLVTGLLAERFKLVYAVEPSSEFREALVLNMEYNGWDNVMVCPCAISYRDGVMTLTECRANTTMRTLMQDYGDGGEEVPTFTLETFMRERSITTIDFLKMDIEGSEVSALEAESFDRIAPRIRAMQVSFHTPAAHKLVQYIVSKGFDARGYPNASTVVYFDRNAK